MSVYASVEVDLVVVTCWCGMPHAVPRSLRDKQQRDHRDGRQQTSVYCPLGHSYVIAGEGEAARLKLQLESEKKRVVAARATNDQLRAELKTTEAKRRAAKGVATKLKKRAANGVCPCCGRTFQQLARHMKTKHPEYVAEGS